MRIKTENGTKWISCDNLGEVVAEFKKFRNSKNASERKNYSFGGVWGDFMSMLEFRTVEHPDGNVSVSEIIDSVKIYQENGTDLPLNVAPLNFREVDWKPYDQKITKILKEIWETGESKHTYGLDLNWPQVSQPNQQNKFYVTCDHCGKYIGNNRELAYFSDIQKNLDFCSENCHTKWKEHSILTEELKKETNQKIIWRAIAIGAVGVGVLLVAWFLVFWFKKRKKSKNSL